MNLIGLLRPKPALSRREVRSGLRWLTWEAIVDTGFSSITSSGFFAAFALALGASNLQIGILAAIPSLSQPLQVAAVPLVERLRWRRAMATFSWMGYQVFWFPIALIPLFLAVPGPTAVLVLLALASLQGVMGALCNSAWNGWVRDLIPQAIMGRYLARRQSLSNLAAMGFGLAAAVFIDRWRATAAPEEAVLGFTLVLILGALTLGMTSVVFMGLMPEPSMQRAPGPRQGMLATLVAPLRDQNFFRFIRFRFLWGAALNLATPFFAVHMLTGMGMSLSAVIGLSIVSQASNVVFLRTWGPLTDKYGSKVVLSLSASLYLLVILGWTFTTMPERHAITVPLLVVLHVMAGAAAAGVNLSTSSFGFKLAPRGQSTAYLAVLSLAASLGSGLGPLVGGSLADFFGARSLSIDLSWTGTGESVNIPALGLSGFDFLYFVTFLLGLVTLRTLAGLKEEGEADREKVMAALMAPMRLATRPMSSVPGLSFLSHLPYSYLRRVPIPGLDVAVGVTVFELADLGKAAAQAASRSRRTVERTVAAVDDVIERAGRATQLTSRAARDALHAVEEVAADVGQLTFQAVHKALHDLGETSIDAEDAYWGTGFGVAYWAMGAGADVPAAAQQAVEAARTTARERGLPEAEVAATTAQGVMAAVETGNPEVARRAREALSTALE